MDEDELEPLITECPNCRTRFRVTETQLQLANGRVRCGACLTVFHGVDHILWDGREALAGDARAEDVLNEVLEELSGPAVPGKKPVVKPQSDKSKDEAVPPAESWVKRSAPFFGGREPDDTAPDSGRRRINPDAYFDTDTDTDTDTETDAVEVRGDAIEVRGDAIEVRGSEAEGEAEPVPGKQEAPAVVSANEPETGSGGWDNAPFKIVDPETTVSDDPTESTDSDDFAESAGQSADPAVVEASPETASRSKVPAPEAAAVEGLDRALQEPISFAPEPRRWWVPIALVAGVLALLLQIFWYQFQSWGRDPLLRPLYAASCDLLGCELPVMQDLRQMRTRNLIVRSHPDTARALIVDAVIVNEWEYAQPFPELELTFKSLNGALVAGRRFKPSEYLSGELAAGDEMPPNTPIRIELEIEDPGPEAVNYFLTFR